MWVSVPWADDWAYSMVDLLDIQKKLLAKVGNRGKKGHVKNKNKLIYFFHRSIHKRSLKVTDRERPFITSPDQ